jgi:hypothetical protein
LNGSTASQLGFGLGYAVAEVLQQSALFFATGGGGGFAEAAALRSAGGIGMENLLLRTATSELGLAAQTETVIAARLETLAVRAGLSGSVGRVESLTSLNPMQSSMVSYGGSPPRYLNHQPVALDVRQATSHPTLRSSVALETQKVGVAGNFESSLPGASSDVASKKRIVPTMSFENPNPRGRNFVKFDGTDLSDSNIFIDRKWNVTTKTDQIAALKRVGEALRQNPGKSLVIEVPNESARRAAIRALNKAGQVRNSQISILIAR